MAARLQVPCQTGAVGGGGDVSSVVCVGVSVGVGVDGPDEPDKK